MPELDRPFLSLQTESLDAYKKTRERHYHGQPHWSILDLPFAEMKELGSRLSPESVTILKGFRDIEGYIIDYILAGIKHLKRTPSYKHIQVDWSGEEFYHATTEDQMLVASGKYTDSEIAEQQDEALTQIWTPDQHEGISSPAGYLCFSTFQEKGTYISYDGFIDHVRGEYGLPIQVTSKEKDRGMEVGISEGLRRIAGDEIYHHGVFLEQLKILYKFYPELTLITLDVVLKAFAMPAMKLIPGGRRFLRALINTGVYRTNTQEEEVILPTLKALGFPSREIFSQAVARAKIDVQEKNIQPDPRLFYVPRKYYAKSMLEAMHHNAWLAERQRKTPTDLPTMEDYQKWAEAYSPYINPFDSLPPGVYDINTLTRIGT